MSHEVWDAISPDAKDLVKRMLHPNPFQRITAAQILEHPWLQEETDEVRVAVVRCSVPCLPLCLLLYCVLTCAVYVIQYVHCTCAVAELSPLCTGLRLLSLPRLL
jgi:hypothetical protein